MRYVFRRKDGQCPECIAFGRRWYIQDRLLYGNVYEHCLMSVTTRPQQVLKFNEKVELVSWLNGFSEYREKDDWWIDWMIRRWTKIDYEEVALIEKDGVQYRYDKVQLTLTALPERRRESGWYESYRECVADAKAFLQKLSTKQNESSGSVLLQEI